MSTHPDSATDHTDKNLDTAITYAATDLARTDTKAGLLLTLDGLLVAALSFLGTDLHGTTLILAIAGAVALVLGVVLALLVIPPALQPGAAPIRPATCTLPPLTRQPSPPR